MFVPIINQKKNKMDKTTRDLVWSVLPKEFKEEVKKIHTELECNPDWGQYRLALQELFGIHNLTSDAEGEEDETLHVSRNKLQYFYEKLRKVGENHAAFALQSLFGSKCLPDETRDKREKRQIKRELNEDNFAKSDAPSTGGKEVNFTTKAQPGTNCNGYDDRRLHIAAQILAALYANELYARHRYMEQLVETALKATDLLIAECGKGDKDGE